MLEIAHTAHGRVVIRSGLHLLTGGVDVALVIDRELRDPILGTREAVRVSECYAVIGVQSEIAELTELVTLKIKSETESIDINTQFLREIETPLKEVGKELRLVNNHLRILLRGLVGEVGESAQLHMVGTDVLEGVGGDEPAVSGEWLLLRAAARVTLGERRGASVVGVIDVEHLRWGVGAILSPIEYGHGLHMMERVTRLTAEHGGVHRGDGSQRLPMGGGGRQVGHPLTRVWYSVIGHSRPRTDVVEDVSTDGYD